jgi:hypothetical protein
MDLGLYPYKKTSRGFALIGMVECWKTGKMGFEILQTWMQGKIPAL